MHLFAFFFFPIFGFGFVFYFLPAIIAFARNAMQVQFWCLISSWVGPPSVG